MTTKRGNDTVPSAATIIPKLYISAALAVSDGAQLAGYVVEHDGSWFAYGRDHVLIGEFESQHAAVCAIPKTD